MFKFSLQIKGNVTRNLNIITHGSLGISSNTDKSISSNFDLTELVQRKNQEVDWCIKYFSAKTETTFRKKNSSLEAGCIKIIHE